MLLGLLGPILVTYHTTFRFNGLVVTSYICMLITMFSGLIGRYIYVQIPRGLAGAELAAGEVESLAREIDQELTRYSDRINLSERLRAVERAPIPLEGSPWRGLDVIVRTQLEDRAVLRRLRAELQQESALDEMTRWQIYDIVRRKLTLTRKRNSLATSRALLHYWHVLHLPLATLMFVIMFIHIAVFYLFRPAE
jgi:hypothetical protein